MKRARFLQLAMLIARRSSTWAHDAAMCLDYGDEMSPDALARFDADIRYGLDRLKDAPDPEGEPGVGGGG